MKGSGIDAFEFIWGDFTCEVEECGVENINAVAFGDDWGRYEVHCEACHKLHYEGSNKEDEDEYYADYDPDDER